MHACICTDLLSRLSADVALYAKASRSTRGVCMRHLSEEELQASLSKAGGLDEAVQMLDSLVASLQALVPLAFRPLHLAVSVDSTR